MGCKSSFSSGQCIWPLQYLHLKPVLIFCHPNTLECHKSKTPVIVFILPYLTFLLKNIHSEIQSWLRIIPSLPGLCNFLQPDLQQLTPLTLPYFSLEQNAACLGFLVDALPIACVSHWFLSRPHTAGCRQRRGLDNSIHTFLCRAQASNFASSQNLIVSALLRKMIHRLHLSHATYNYLPFTICQLFIHLCRSDWFTVETRLACQTWNILHMQSPALTLEAAPPQSKAQTPCYLH